MHWLYIYQFRVELSSRIPGRSQVTLLIRTNIYGTQWRQLVLCSALRHNPDSIQKQVPPLKLSYLTEMRQRCQAISHSRCESSRSRGVQAPRTSRPGECCNARRGPPRSPSAQTHPGSTPPSFPYGWTAPAQGGRSWKGPRDAGTSPQRPRALAHPAPTAPACRTARRSCAPSRCHPSPSATG